jgi:hypothetical protein
MSGTVRLRVNHQTSPINAKTSIRPSVGKTTCWVKGRAASAGRSNGKCPLASRTTSAVSRTHAAAATQIVG